VISPSFKNRGVVLKFRERKYFTLMEKLEE
jgi:hypothetical protein